MKKFSELMESIDRIRRNQLESMKQIAEKDAAFALALDVQDGCWDAMDWLLQVESMTYTSGKEVDVEKLIENMKDSMCSTFAGSTGRDYLPKAVSNRYSDIKEVTP